MPAPDARAVRTLKEMKIIFYIFALTVALTSPGRTEDLQEQKFGNLTGQVVYERNDLPVPWANVVIAGTRLGAQTDTCGNFSIINVPSGTYTIKCMMMYYNTAEIEGINILSNETSSVDFHLTERYSNIALDDTSLQTGFCYLHDNRMTAVLVPVSSGLRPTRTPSIEFPNAEPDIMKDNSIDPIMKALCYRCSHCVQARNAHIGGDIWTYSVSNPIGWRLYDLGSTLRFLAPPGLTNRSLESKCMIGTEWANDQINIQVFKGPNANVKSFWPRMKEFEYVINLIVDGTYPDIGIVRADDRSIEILVGFWAIPVDTDKIFFRVRIDGSDAFERALQIIDSIKFL